MKAVAGVNIPIAGLRGQKVLETGCAVSNQITKTGTQTAAEETETQFIKCLINEFSQLEKAQENKTDTESRDKRDGDCDTTAISGLLTQLFFIQSPAKASATGEKLSEGQTAVSDGLPAGKEGAAAIAAQFAEKQNETTAAMQFSGKEDGAAAAAQLAKTENGASEAMQFAGKKSGAVDGLQNLGDSPEPIGGLQNDEEPGAAFQFSEVMESGELVSAPSYEVLRKNEASAEQNVRGHQPEQTPEEDGGQEKSVIKGNIAENIIEAMKYESRDGKTGQSNEKMFKDKDKPISTYLSKENSAVGDMVKAGGSMEDMGYAQKSQAVEKAISRFLNDFRGAERGKSEIQIVLEPESLGALTISVTHTENGISAKIKSEDREICAMISNQIEKLIHSMESKGMAVENVDVLFSGTEQNFNFANNFGGRQEQSAGYSARPGGKTETVDGSGFFDQWRIAGSSGSEAGGTIEYRI